MFERRLTIVLWGVGIWAVVVLARLGQLQLIRGGDFLRKSDAALVSPTEVLPPLRGRILDRWGRVLIADEPAHDVTVHYGALSLDESYIRALEDWMRRREPRWKGAPGAEVRGEVLRRLAEMWTALAEASGRPTAELRRQRDSIFATVEALRQHVWKARRGKGFDEPLKKIHLREEEMFHPVLRDVTPEARTRIELAMPSLPCLRIEPSVRRAWQQGTRTVCHLLGRMGQVSAQDLERDPLRDDSLACYRPGDVAGVSGVEHLAEPMLRGKRGFDELRLDGTRLRHQPPMDGLDLQLTIDLELQEQIAGILGTAVAEQSHPGGASCVVIDVATREVLALVSLPDYDADEVRRDYRRLRDDGRRRPLLFRAVAEEYQPGSILKPVNLLAGLALGAIGPTTRVQCDGSYVQDANKWHCWTHWKSLPGHGSLDPEEAILHSCNIYFYTLGDRLGAGRLTDFCRQFILGPVVDPAGAHGTGLIEERSGIVPTYSWLKDHRNRGYNKADARNYAIGQGELQFTPLQAANMFATLADGAYREPTLIANDCRIRPPGTIPRVTDEMWALVRRGLFRCVNEDGGTAQKYVKMNSFEICGKTGSAQCVSRVVTRRYTFEAVGEEPRSIVAPSIESAREQLNLPPGARCTSRAIVERWPPPDPRDGKVPTHAWFAGYAPARQPRIALAVVIEYGGGGGNTAGPVAREIFQSLLKNPRGYLQPGAELAVGDAP